MALPLIEGFISLAREAVFALKVPTASCLRLSTPCPAVGPFVRLPSHSLYPSLGVELPNQMCRLTLLTRKWIPHDGVEVWTVEGETENETALRRLSGTILQGGN